MNRKTTPEPARVYNYGCYRGVTVNAELVEDQYRKAHAYQQKLVELELNRRRAHFFDWLRRCSFSFFVSIKPREEGSFLRPSRRLAGTPFAG
jgi:hypothetical protein